MARPIRDPQNGHVVRLESAAPRTSGLVRLALRAQPALAELGADGRRPGTVRAHEPRPRNVSATCRRARLRWRWTLILGMMEKR